MERIMSKVDAVIAEKVAERLSVDAIKSLLPAPSLGSSSAGKDAKETATAPSTPTAASAGALSSLMAASGFKQSAKRVKKAPAAAELEEDDPISDDDAPAPAASRGVDLSKPVAALLWTEEIMPFGSAISFVRMSQWNDKRNKHEAESLAWSLDAFVSEDLPTKSVSFEVQVRRLLGVKLADEHRDWALAEALAWKSGHGVQNRGLLRSLLKDRKNFVDLNKSSSVKTRGTFKSAVTSSRSGGRGGRGRGGRFQNASQHNNSSQKPSSGGSDAAAR